MTLEHKPLLQMLLATRKMLAAAADCAPFMICPERTLAELVCHMKEPTRRYD